MRRLPVLALLLALVGASCTSSRWQFVRDRPPGKATTEVRIRTVPENVEVRLRDDYMGQSPVAIPIRYSYEVKVYQRRKALPYPSVEEKEHKTYVRNEFVFQFFKPGYVRTERTVTLEGEEAVDLEVTLTPVKN